MRRLISAQCAVMVFLCLAGCRESRPIVGTWFVKTPEAPFPHHMLVFHSDGTVGAERVGDARVLYRLIQLHQHHATVSGRRQRGDQQTVISAVSEPAAEPEA